ncbi:hypothetical protein [Streptomyces minutiscleroticus]|uniref:hypothetical protein n=1 Tax=Streptomyces minutiscleroticus TaxID=68238 RepID=UPI00331AF7BE
MAVAVTSGVLPSAATAAVAADTPAVAEAVVPAAERTTDLAASLQAPEQIRDEDGAGAEGVFHRMESAEDPGGTKLVWTRYADGRTFPVPDACTAGASVPTGSDFLARRPDSSTVELWNAADGTSRTVRLPQGQTFLVAYGSTVATMVKTTAEDGTSVNTLHLLSPTRACSDPAGTPPSGSSRSARCRARRPAA